MVRATRFIVGLLVMSFLASNLLAKSNCYIRLPDKEDDSNWEANRNLVESYGGRIIHEFPPNEFICEIVPSQFRIFTNTVHAVAQHKEIGTDHKEPRSSQTIAEFCWNTLLNADDEPPLPKSAATDTELFCGTHNIDAGDGLSKSPEDLSQ